MTNSFQRPSLPEGFDDSRARERRDDPAGQRFNDEERAGVWRAIRERRDVRKFRPDVVPDTLVTRLLEAAHAAPSVGLSQPWRFIVVRSDQIKSSMQALAHKERLVQAEYLGERTSHFLDLKVEGIRDAPLSIFVACDRGDPDVEILGRHTIRDTDIYSACLAIENFWLAARAEGVGVGWVSFYRNEDVRRLLELPDNVEPLAWLCVGYPDERQSRPGLEASGWGERLALSDVTFYERWGTTTQSTAHADLPASPREIRGVPRWCATLVDRVLPGDASAAIGVRDAGDELVKPPGSLGVLENVLERWALATGSPAPDVITPAILVFAGDHGVASHHVSLFPARVSAQVAAAAARGETAIGVLARAHNAELDIVDVGLEGPAVPGVRHARVADATADITMGPAMSDEQLRSAFEIGFARASELVSRCDVLIVGEIGIGNTTVASALLAALTESSALEVCGRGTGLDAQGLDRKRDAVTSALAVNQPNAHDALECLRTLGGFEFAALCGAMIAAGAAKRPVLLDGFATGVAALVACRLQPALRDYLIAGHCSAEVAHQRVLTELGLEPLLRLRLRLGEASGAALALPLLSLASRLQTQMFRFDDAGVDSQ